MADHDNSASAPNINFPTQPEKEKVASFPSIFGTIVCFIFKQSCQIQYTLRKQTPFPRFVCSCRLCSIILVIPNLPIVIPEETKKTCP